MQCRVPDFVFPYLFALLHVALYHLIVSILFSLRYEACYIIKQHVIYLFNAFLGNRKVRCDVSLAYSYIFILFPYAYTFS